MALSREVRRLEAKWESGTAWPKRLDWIEIEGIRGWEGQRFDLRFPIMALVGENGTGKSTVLQAAASVYRPPSGLQRRERFASEFFPDTAWDKVRKAEIRYAVREGSTPHQSSVRKPTDRWRGNPERRMRDVVYIDLSRIQPVPARVGYSKLANPSFAEISADLFDQTKLTRLSEILGRPYDLAKMAVTSGDANRRVPVIVQHGSMYSGFHQGAGETTIAELLEVEIPKYSLVLIDEIESSLHPRAQRRLMRDLAEKCRQSELQVILTTHSPYILEELPLHAHAQILFTSSGRRIVYGVSPMFAMTKMDDAPHHECDLYVEDERAKRMLVEILTAHDPDLVQRCQVIPFGAASVGEALGQMVKHDRFPRATAVFLDGDRDKADGCEVLPGDDSPERVVFEGLKAAGWPGVCKRTGRTSSDVIDACEAALLIGDHHEWVRHAANRLVLGGDTLWQAMCAEWVTACLPSSEGLATVQIIRDRLEGIEGPSARSGGRATGTQPATRRVATHGGDSHTQAAAYGSADAVSGQAELEAPAPAEATDESSGSTTPAVQSLF